MASLNRGIFIDGKNFDREVMRDEVKNIFKKVPGVTDVVFFSDSEITSIATTLANRIRKAMENVQEGLVGVNDPDDIYSDPVFLEKFNSTLVINVREDHEDGEKFVFIDRSNAINLDDDTLIRMFAMLCKSKSTEVDMLLHIPTVPGKASQIECFYNHKNNTIVIEVIGGGAPVLILSICKLLTPKEIEALEDKTQDKKIITVPMSYGSVAEMYDEMLSFILDQPSYDKLYLGISRNKDDVPVPAEINSLYELYTTTSLMQAQIAPNGVLESNVLTLPPKV